MRARPGAQTTRVSPTSRLALLAVGVALVVVVPGLLHQPADRPGTAASMTAPRPASAFGTPEPPVGDGALAVPAPLNVDGLGIMAGPVAVPLELRLPSLDLSASVLGVGLTPGNVMDAPMGGAEDPVWQQAFWYRGSAVPGAASTALIAGHVSDPLGRPGVFASIERLKVGDPIVVHDARSGLDVRFAVTGSDTYSLREATERTVLARIYGEGPVAGTAPQASADGLSHLSLITCAGTFKKGTHDHRLVVSATRVA